MPHPLFADTMFSGTESKSDNKCAQVFASNFGWACSFPLRRKGKAHEALSLLFKRKGLPPEMILDGSREQIQPSTRLTIPSTMLMTKAHLTMTLSRSPCPRQGTTASLLKSCYL